MLGSEFSSPFLFGSKQRMPMVVMHCNESHGWVVEAVGSSSFDAETHLSLYHIFPRAPFYQDTVEKVRGDI